MDQQPPADMELTLRTLAMPADANPAGDIFGGWVMSQMDLAAFVRANDVAGGRTVTVADLYEAGLSGKADSAALRKRFLRSLSLPERLSTGALVDMINIFMTYDEFQESIKNFSLNGDDDK